jgi:ribokinase
MGTRPDLLILGQVTIDDVVPASPGAWRRQPGGSSLYTIAGARLWLDPARIGLVARIGRGYPFAVAEMLQAAGIRHVALRPVPEEHLVEWLIYEPDGSRRSLPRNAGMLDVGAEGASSMPSAVSAYHDRLLAIAPTAEDIPDDWLPAAAVHLCTQVGERHGQAVQALRARAGCISVDPSPHYSRLATAAQLWTRLRGADAFLPSANEVSRLLGEADAGAVALALHQAGFAEVALKRGAADVLVASEGAVSAIATAPATVVDPTGAGDSFCGAYAACRLLGLSPVDAARRATQTAALVVGCSGVDAALQLSRLAP